MMDDRWHSLMVEENIAKILQLCIEGIFSPSIPHQKKAPFLLVYVY